MGTLECQRCGAKADGKTFDEADEKIDHAIGLSIGRPCSGDAKNLIWRDEKPTSETVTAKATKPTKPKKGQK